MDGSQAWTSRCYGMRSRAPAKGSLLVRCQRNTNGPLSELCNLSGTPLATGAGRGGGWRQNLFGAMRCLHRWCDGGNCHFGCLLAGLSTSGLQIQVALRCLPCALQGCADEMATRIMKMAL